MSIALVSGGIGIVIGILIDFYIETRSRNRRRERFLTQLRQLEALEKRGIA